jgi:hypothetical protein
MDLFRKQTAKILKYFKKEKRLLILILFLGLILRLFGLLNITLAGDNLLHWKIAGEIATHGFLPLLGPRASITESFNLGPLYYYLLAIPYFLGEGNFKIAIIFFAILNSLSIFVLFYVAKRWFSKIDSLKICLLYAVSSYYVQIQSFPWNPNVLPLFIILCLYFVNKVFEKKFLNIIFFAICFGICLQLHATAIFLLPVFIYLMNFKKVPLKYYLLGGVFIIAVNFPWILVNLTTNFSQIKAAQSIFISTKAEQCSILNWVANHGNGEKCFWYLRNTLLSFRFLTVSIFGINSIPLALLGMGITLWYFVKTQFKENIYLLFWATLIAACFLFYSNNIYLHYFIIMTPLPFFLIVTYFKKIKWKPVVNGLFISIIIINLIQYFWSLQFLRG